MNHSEAQIDSVIRLSEEFIERFRRGERPSINEYTRKYPHLADQIGELFPTLITLETCAPESASEALQDPAAFGDAPKQIGDYQIQREIGRGGMGVVYEALQLSLRRQVALKILGGTSVSKETALKRFQLEAQAAGRLHHAHIVPVYDVGQEQGCWYYAMQLIAGHGLDQVLVELRRLRSGVLPEGAVESPARTTAQSLLSEKVATPWATTQVAAEADQGTDGQHAVPPAAKLPADNDSQTPPAPNHATQDAQHGSTVDTRLQGSTDRWPLSSESHLSDSHSSRGQYYRGVARIGSQVARALEYAHGEGIVHRDIKPSNLILDHKADVWITDFGLAKAQGNNLTVPGDVVGTLRYMAPERFRGWSDPRSDVYGLGVTLYELLVLRPAFDCDDRVELVRHVTQSPAPPPRTIDPRVPRELETIVLKAMAKEPGDRYQTAQELADDLQCFLEDRPITARRAGPLERSWRWCRRNAPVAALGGSLIAVLALGCAGMFMLWQNSVHQRDRALRGEQLSREAIDDLVATVVDDDSLSQAWRRRILNWAVDHYQRSIEQSQQLPDSEFQLAAMHEQVGVLRGLMGDWQSAIQSFDQQRELLQKVLGHRSSNLDLAGAYRNLAECSARVGQAPQAINYCELASSALEEIPAATRDATALEIEADVLSIRVATSTMLGKSNGARDLASRAVQLHQQLHGDRLDDIRAELGLAETRNIASALFRRLGQLDVARDHAEQSLIHARRLLERRPQSPELAIVLATSYCNLAATELQVGNFATALDHGNAALQVMERLEEHQPSRRLAWYLMRAHDLAGTARFEVGQVDEARKHFQEAVALQNTVALASGGYLARISTNHATTLRFHGDGSNAVQRLHESIAICRNFLQVNPWDVPSQHQLARALGNLAEGHANKQTSHAQDWIDEAIQIHRQIAELDKEVPIYQVSLAKHYRVLASMRYLAGEFDDALQQAQLAEATLQPVRTQHPALLSAARELAQVNYLRGLVHRKRQDPDAAIAALQRAVDLWNARPATAEAAWNPNVAVVFASACRNLAQLKHEHQQDAATAEQLLTQAINALQHVLAHDPQHPVAQQFLTKSRAALDQLN